MENKLVVIAEAGVNHNGDFLIAKKMIDVAAKSGADYVKFQTFKAENLVTRKAEMAQYQKNNIRDNHKTQFNLLKKLELPYSWHQDLIDYCSINGVKFLSTPFDIESLEFLLSLNVRAIKISSGDITNYPLLTRVFKADVDVILSTGMSTMEEIKCVFNLLPKDYDLNKITMLHCNTDYPTKFQDVNLRAMRAIENKFRVKVGYSDHTDGFEVSLAAVGMGACMIEKHFTLDKSMIGPDHVASLNPEELMNFVRLLRNVEISLGSCVKQPSPSELKNMSVARKSIVAAQRIKKGDIFTVENLTVKRPGSGLSPMMWPQIIGTKSQKDYFPDDLI